jgi:hypothetical protein
MQSRLSSVSRTEVAAAQYRAELVSADIAAVSTDFARSYLRSRPQPDSVLTADAAIGREAEDRARILRSRPRIEE